MASELLVYLARAMDARSDVDILLEEEKYSFLLESIGASIANPYKIGPRDPIHNGRRNTDADFRCLKKCGIILADISLKHYQYVGCIFEIVEAVNCAIPIILVVGDSGLHERMYFQSHCEFITREPHEAVDYIRRVHTKSGIEMQLEEMKLYYNAIANRYGDQAIRTHDRSASEMAGFMTERSELRRVLRRYVNSDNEVCQIGIGTGDWTTTICECAAKVTAIEQSSEMLSQAKINLANFDNIKYYHSDIMGNNETITRSDIVVAYFLLSLYPPSAQVLLLECIRNFLRPRGILIVADTNKLGDVQSMGLGRRRIQRRECNARIFHLYKEHFDHAHLRDLMAQNEFEIITASADSVWFSWTVSRKTD